MFGLNPLTVSSYLDCITLCSNQGSICAGITYGYFGGGTLQCNLKTRMLRSNQVPAFPVDSALRVSGPLGPNNRLQLISNGDFFGTDSLAPWTSDVFSVGFDTGAASVSATSLLAHTLWLTTIQDNDVESRHFWSLQSRRISPSRQPRRRLAIFPHFQPQY